MTATDTPALTGTLAKLALLFNTKGVSEELVDVWLDALSDVPWPKAAAAFEEYARHGKHWPRPGAIRALVDRAAVASAVSVKGRIPDDPMAPPHCLACEDTGFVLDLRCPGDGRCGFTLCKQGSYRPHTFTRRCACRSTNPVFQASLRRSYHREDVA